MLRDGNRHVCPASDWPAANDAKWTPAALNRDRLTGLSIRKHCLLQWLKHFGTTATLVALTRQVLDT